jgi:hypothetical protein
MPYDEKKKIPTASQKRAAEAAQAPMNLPAVKATGTQLAAVMPAASYRSRYLDEVAPQSIVGTMVKFSKDGVFTRQDNEKTIAEDEDFLALCDEVLVGWVKFNGVGEAPDKEMGLLYGDYVMPARESLGDMDEAKWEQGLDGSPQDPWQHHMYLPLQNSRTKEMLTFVTSSKTGRRAVGTLLRHFDRLRRTKPGHVPVVEVRSGGFNHSDTRIGWVNTPMFVVMTTAPRDEAAVPDTSIEGILNDALPDNMR